MSTADNFVGIVVHAGGNVKGLFGPRFLPGVVAYLARHGDGTSPEGTPEVKAVVCVKQVVAIGDEIAFTDDGKSVDGDYLDHAVNEWDVVAVEEALRMTEAASAAGEESEVVVVTVGGEENEEALRRCLAMGAQRAIRVEGQSGALLDPLTVARRLAPVVAREAADVVLCGVQSSDSVQAAVGTMLAELLELPRVAVVKEISLDRADGTATVMRELEGGLVDVVEVDLPALLTVQTGINEPRYATLRAIKQANLKEIEVVEPSQDAPGCYEILRIYAPPRGEGAEMLEGSPAEVAARIVELVKARLS